MSKSGNKKSKLLYITSVGHSGSTLLDLLCGSIPEVFSLGEVQFLSWQLFQGEIAKDPQTYCSCGENFKKCKFWRNIFKEVNEETKRNIYDNPSRHDYSLNRYIIRHKTKLFLRIINKFLALSLRKSNTKFIARLIYWFYLPSIKRNWDLFDKVATESKSEFVVDSSKNFLRYWLLREHRPNDVKLIILIRDLKGVASSSHNGLNDKIIKDRAQEWLKFYNVEIEPVFYFREKNNYLKVQYENLCKNPTKLRNEIANFLNLNQSEEKFEYIEPYNNHTIQGNPIRLHKDKMKIVYDERWRKRLNQNQIKLLNNLSSELKYFNQIKVTKS